MTKITAVPNAVAYAATNNKTLVQVLAGTNNSIIIQEFGFSFDGVIATDSPMFCRLVIQTTAGTGTALTLEKLTRMSSHTIQASALHIYTSQPTDGAILLQARVTPAAGRWVWQAPDDELWLPGGTRVALRVTAGTTLTAVNGNGYLHFKE